MRDGKIPASLTDSYCILYRSGEPIDRYCEQRVWLWIMGTCDHFSKCLGMECLQRMASHRRARSQPTNTKQSTKSDSFTGASQHGSFNQLFLLRKGCRNCQTQRREQSAQAANLFTHCI